MSTIAVFLAIAFTLISIWNENPLQMLLAIVLWVGALAWHDRAQKGGTYD